MENETTEMDTGQDKTEEVYREKLTFKESLIVIFMCVVIVSGSVALAMHFLSTKSRPKRRPPLHKDPLVEIQSLHPVNQQIIIPVMGTVIPALEINLQSRVSGEIFEIHPEFMAGGIVKKGETLLKLDSEDYQLVVISRKAQLEKAHYELKMEQSQQDIAKREWELMDLKNQASELDREIALRLPHLRSKQAQLKATEAEMSKALLDLERTYVKAPFNAIIRIAEVNIGDQVSPQTLLAKLVATDAYWVQASITVNQLKWMKLSRGNKNSQPVARIKTTTGNIYQGRVLKLLSELEPNGRLARLLIEVKDPLDLKSSGNSYKQLLLGEYVHIEIEGKVLENVFSIPRTVLQDGNRIWLADAENKLSIQPVDIVWKEENRVLVRGVKPGDRLIVTNLTTPIQGMKLRIIDSNSPQTPALVAKQGSEVQGSEVQGSGVQGLKDKKENEKRR